MKSQDPRLVHPPTLALKEALCYTCLDISSNLSRCNACKRVSYCSAKCQKQDWNRNHKTICKKLVSIKQQNKPIPSAGRQWDDYYREQVLLLDRYSSHPDELRRLLGFTPYCRHCYRRESQLEDGERLNACQHCFLTSFCTSCQQTHSSDQCATFKDIVLDDKITVDLRRKTGKSSAISFTKSPRKIYVPLSSATDWYAYYTKLSDMGVISSMMSRELRYLFNDPKEREYVNLLRHATNTITIQLTLIAALEITMPDISTRTSISIHILGAAGSEYVSLQVFEDLLHLIPSLVRLQLVFVGPNVFGNPSNETEIQYPYPHQCCAECTKMGRAISMSTWKGPYHSYIKTPSYKSPDLAAAFQTGFTVDDQDKWFPTIEHLVHAPHPTLFTSFTPFEAQGENDMLHMLGAKFVKKAEVNKWKGMSPKLGVCSERSNAIIYRNYWWYIVGGK